MSWESSEPRILSRPVRLHWAGWRSDTFTLQKAGWQLAAEQNVYENALQIFLKHPRLKITGISDRIDFKYLDTRTNEMDYLRGLTLACNLSPMEHRIYESHLSPMAFSEVKPIDATPTYVEYKITNLEDMKFFRTIETDIQQVTLEKATLAEVLDFALKKQKPRQDEIRLELLKRDHLETIKRDSQIMAELRMIA